MLDDYAYGYELANPGELDSWNSETRTSTKILRIYTVVDGVQYYTNVPESFRSVDEARLSDGSYIPEKVTWNVEGFLATIGSVEVDSFNPAGVDKETGNDGKTFGTTPDSSLAAKLKSAKWKQLPLHKCILLGADALIETGIEGHTQPKMYVKPLGSAGVLDPIDQRQSIGFKIDTIGYSLLKPEACVVCYTIPTGAVDTI